MNKNIPTTRVHSYNVSVASDVGINAAVIFYNICYWVEENTANERNYINGEYWTYNTVSAFKELFPEMTYEQVRNALRKLEDKKYIKSAFLNEDTRDRTKWYTVVDKKKWIMSTKCICENSQMENGKATNDYNIYNNIDTNTNNKQSDNKQSVDMYAFSEDKSSSKDNMYAFQSGDCKAEKPKKENRYIPEDYTEEQLIEHIKEPIVEKFKESYGLNEKSEECKDLLKTIILFYKIYQLRTGKRHRILSDVAYKRIVTRYMTIPKTTHSYMRYDYDIYSELVLMYFETDYAKDTVYDISHFMSDKIRGNLFEKSGLY